MMRACLVKRWLDSGLTIPAQRLALCVHALMLFGLVSPSHVHSAPAPSIVLDNSSPTLSIVGAQAGEILSPGAPPATGALPSPVVSLFLASLGLVAGDVPIAISFGLDAIPSGVLFFGVDRAADGIAGLFPPDIDSQGQSGAAGDIYRSNFPPNHTQVLDGDGQGGSPAPLGLGLDESGPSIDNLVGFTMCPVGAVDSNADGVLESAVYFSLAAGSPSLVLLSAGPQDVLRSRVGPTGAATVWLLGSALGLVAGDEIDGLASDGSTVYFSLAPGSPTLLGPDGEADPNNDPDPDDLAPGDVMSQAFVSVYPFSALNLKDDDNLVGLSLGFDQDNDLVSNSCDNCSSIANPDQADTDVDTVGDICDNCLSLANADQLDADFDGAGDACDADDDDDTILDLDDNCRVVANLNQLDGDVDEAGDACDNCLGLPNASQDDLDIDGVGDPCDNCPAVSNAPQLNNDADLLGDLCDDDDDNDGVLDVSDNCGFDANFGQENNDGDLLGDVCDLDDDNDIVPDAFDNCPLIANFNQSDAEKDEGPDGAPGFAGVDDDAVNGVDDPGELCPPNGAGFPWPIPGSDDVCGDGIGDVCDSDDDNDTLSDAAEILLGTNPLVADTDGDSFDDGEEVALGSDPLDADDFPLEALTVSATGVLNRVLLMGALLATGISTKRFAGRGIGR